MNLKISTYDFFAYTIPGALYLVAGIHAGSVVGLVQMDWRSLDLSLAQILVCVALSYILGYIFEPLERQWYVRCFKPKHLFASTLEQFNRRHPGVEIKAPAYDWPILLAYIRRESQEVATEIESHQVSSLMLRSVSLGLALLAVVEVVHLLLSGTWPYLVIAILLAGGSVAAGREAVKFARWFHGSILEAIAALSLEQSSLVSRRPPAAQAAAASGAESPTADQV